MSRFLTISLRRRLEAVGPGWVIQPAVALGCVAIAAISRALIDLVAPGALAFGIVYPCCVLATLLAGWRAGLLTLIIAGLLAWFFSLNAAHTFIIPDVKNRISTGLFFLTALFIIVLADQAVSEQDRVIGQRELLIEEINHRTKNNFQLVLSLLELQGRKSDDPAVKEALKVAVSRISGLARSHRNLYGVGNPDETVALDVYLGELCDNIFEASTAGGLVQVERDLRPYSLARDRAVAVGVVLNEAVTNALKHAFAERGSGVIRVSLMPTAEGAELTVADDGVGFSTTPAPSSGSGLGRGLIDAFARQAGGVIERTRPAGGGAAVTLVLKT